MTRSCRLSFRLAWLVPTLLLALAPAAQAASASIDRFTASATRVNVGDTIDFSVQFSVFTSSNTSGGSDPFEPAIGGELFCDSRTPQRSDADDHDTADGTFSTGGIHVEVLEPTVAVREPATGPLWLAGAGLPGWRLRRRGALR